MNRIIAHKKIAIIFLITILVIIVFFTWVKILESKIEIRKISANLSANTLNAVVPINGTLQPKTQINPVKATILIYHSVRPASDKLTKSQKAFDVDNIMFEKQIQYLIDNNYKIISMDELSKHYQNNNHLPNNAVIINFDDGWKNQYTYAYPILKKYGVTATFFIYTDKIGVGHSFMNWDEIMDLQNNGMQIESHSISHPILTRMHNDDTLLNEISQSKKILEQKLNKPIKIFAYPYGMYDDKSIDVVKNSGYELARGIYHGRIHSVDTQFKETGYLVSNDFNSFLKILNK